MKKLLFLLFISILYSCQPKATDEVSQWEAQAENVTIIRDDFGVPHIYGKTDADAVFGLLYAQCEDDFARVERNYVWATGRLAEMEGEDALYRQWKRLKRLMTLLQNGFKSFAMLMLTELIITYIPTQKCSLKCLRVSNRGFRCSLAKAPLVAISKVFLPAE